MRRQSMGGGAIDSVAKITSYVAPLPTPDCTFSPGTVTISGEIHLTISRTTLKVPACLFPSLEPMHD